MHSLLFWYLENNVRARSTMLINSFCGLLELMPLRPLREMYYIVSKHFLQALFCARNLKIVNLKSKIRKNATKTPSFTKVDIPRTTIPEFAAFVNLIFAPFA